MSVRPSHRNGSGANAQQRGMSPHLANMANSFNPSMARAPSWEPPQFSSRTASPGRSPPSTGRCPRTIQVIPSNNKHNAGSPVPSHRGRLCHPLGRPLSHQHIGSGPLFHSARAAPPQARGVRHTSRSYSPPPTPLQYAREPVTSHHMTRRVTPVPLRADSASRAAQAASPSLHHEALAPQQQRVPRLSSGQIVVPVGVAGVSTGAVSGFSVPSSSSLSTGQSLTTNASCPSMGVVPTWGGVQQQMFMQSANRAQSAGVLSSPVPTLPIQNSAVQAPQQQTGMPTQYAVSTMPTLNEQLPNPLPTVVADGVLESTQTTARKSASDPRVEAMYQQLELQCKKQQELMAQREKEKAEYKKEITVIQDKLRREEEAHELTRQDYSLEVSQNGKLLKQTQNELSEGNAKCMEFESKYVQEQTQREELERRQQEMQEMLTRSEKNRALLMDEKIALEAQKNKIVHEIREKDDAARDSQTQLAALQSELQVAQRQVMEAEDTLKSWYDRSCAFEQENHSLQSENHTLQSYAAEHKRIIADLERKLQNKELESPCIQTPGDLLKKMKTLQEDKENQSAHNLQRQNSELKKELVNCQTYLELTLRKVEEKDAHLARFAAAH